MKTMKQNPVAVLGWSGARDSAWGQGVIPGRLAVWGVAICAVLLQCLISARAADVLPIGEQANHSRQDQKPAFTARGREMERYKAFARQADLPVMTVTTNALVEVGGALKLDVARLTQISARDKETLAGQFSVPVGVVDRVVQRVATNSPSAPDQLVRELRTAVVDYRFLQLEWERFHPPADGQPTRSNALSALQAGDLARAWELYDGLARPESPAIAKPAPPTNLRIVVRP